jgi:hypothetical protein
MSRSKPCTLAIVPYFIIVHSIREFKDITSLYMHFSAPSNQFRHSPFKQLRHIATQSLPVEVSLPPVISCGSRFFTGFLAPPAMDEGANTSRPTKRLSASSS